MPLTAKGEEILANMKKEYGAEEGERVFYASKQKGTITGVDSDEAPLLPVAEAIKLPTIRAAGIIFRCKDKALFLQRSGEGDHAGEWCYPGGRIEDGESAIAAAKRECREEIGRMPKGDVLLHTRRISTENPPVDFTTFVVKVDEEFEPTLNEEHTGYAWAPISAPPQPLHPGSAFALAKFTMNEYEIAEAIRYGNLTSPQEFMGVWLFDMRITGTGTAYRSKHEEFVFRPPENYLHPGFLARCYGLEVIVEHPKGDTLDSDQFRERTIGAIMLPYVGDGIRHPADEVWGIARIRDAAAAKMMLENQLSTSPSVVFRPSDGNTSLEIDGAKILIEGNPSLLDHLAVCRAGVWDKGGAPTGIEVTRGDSAMAGEPTLTEVMDSIRKFGDSLKSVGDAVAECNKRMDSMEEERKADAKKRADAEKEEKERADAKAKADAEEKERADAKAKADAEEEEKKKADAKAKADAEEEEKKKADAARADAAIKDSPFVKDLLKTVTDLRGALQNMPATASMIPEADRSKFADAQRRADAAYTALGMRARPPMVAELLADYERDLVKGLQQHSARWKDADVLKMADEATFNHVRDDIYASAIHAAMNPVVPEGQLIKVARDLGGRQAFEFKGRPESWMKTFMAQNRATSTAAISPGATARGISAARAATH